MEKDARFVIIEYTTSDSSAELVKAAMLGNGDVITYPYEFEEVVMVYGKGVYLSNDYVRGETGFDKPLKSRHGYRNRSIEIISRHSIKKIILTQKYIDYNI